MTGDTTGLSRAAAMADAGITPRPDADALPAAHLLRLTRANAAAATLLEWALRWHADGQPWRFSSAEVEAATGLRPGLVLDGLAALAGLRLLRMTYHGRDVRLEVQRIARHLDHPERPAPSPMFASDVPPAYRERRKPTGAEGRALLAHGRPTPDDLLTGLVLGHVDAVERDLRSLEESDDDAPEGDQ